MSTMQRIVGTVCALALAAFSGTAASAQATQPARGLSTGIKVHGHWTIEIKNSDGTLVRRHEFENALTSDGARTLARYLGRLEPPGQWALLLWSPAGTPNCSPNFIPCSLSEASTTAPLSVSVNFDTLTLTGSFTSPDARSFTNAYSQVSSRGFTSKDFPAIPVQAGQIVQVTLSITFS